MNLDEYQKLAVETAVYPKNRYAVLYPALGLGDESGEVAEVVLAGTFRSRDVLLELGDVLWYTASLCDDLGIDMETGLKGLPVSSEQYQDSMGDLVLHLTVAASKVQGCVKKSVRKSVDFDREKLSKLLGEVVTWISVIAYRLGSHVEEVAAMNIDKLRKRKAEGTIDAITRNEVA